VSVRIRRWATRRRTGRAKLHPFQLLYQRNWGRSEKGEAAEAVSASAIVRRREALTDNNLARPVRWCFAPPNTGYQSESGGGAMIVNKFSEEEEESRMRLTAIPGQRRSVADEAMCIT